MARNGIAKLILRIFVDPQNDIPAGKSRLIKHCKSLLSSAKWETTKGNQLQVYRARSLFSDFLETSIDYSPTSCLLYLIINTYSAQISIWIYSDANIQMRINAEYIQIPPLCKTIEKMEKGNNKKSNYLFPSFLPFCPFSRTSTLRLMFYLWNCQSCKGGHDFFLNAQIVSIRKNKTHKFFMTLEKQSCKVNWKQS